MTNWLTSPSWWKNYCYDDSGISSRFTASAVAARTNEVAGAILNVAAAMTAAGYGSGDYKIIVQTYSSPLPRGGRSVTRRADGPGSRSAGVASGTVMPIGPTTPRS